MHEQLLTLRSREGGGGFQTKLNELVYHPDIAFDSNYGYYMLSNTGTEDERYELNIPKGYVGRVGTFKRHERPDLVLLEAAIANSLKTQRD